MSSEDERPRFAAEPAPVSRRQDRPGLALLTTHWLSRVGLVLVVTALCSLLFVLPSQLHGHEENPYKGLVVYLILPGVFFVGLGMVVAGIALGRRRVLERLRTGIVNPARAGQRFLVFLAVTIVVNLVAGTQLTYKAVEYLDTPQFCGATCHTERPEFVGHRDSNHSSVPCAECHVAPGQRGWVESKMNGTRQLFHMLTGNYTLPAPPALVSGKLVPVATDLRALPLGREDRRDAARRASVVRRRRANTASYTAIMMLVGGSRMKGIHHAHFAGGFEIRYGRRTRRARRSPGWSGATRRRARRGPTSRKEPRPTGRGARQARHAVRRLPQPADACVPAARPGARSRAGARSALRYVALHQEARASRC